LRAGAKANGRWPELVRAVLALIGHGSGNRQRDAAWIGIIRKVAAGAGRLVFFVLPRCLPLELGPCWTGVAVGWKDRGSMPLWWWPGKVAG